MSVPQVSVLLPLAGGHAAGEALPATCRAWLRQERADHVVVDSDGRLTPVPCQDDDLAILNERLEAGVEAMIEEDRR